MIKFEVGKTYTTRSICDHNCIFSYTVASRTEKTITLTNGKKLKPYIYEDIECARPEGIYSMCPVIRANK